MEQRRRGLELMEAVYGSTFGLTETSPDSARPVSKPLVESTVDHLFPDVWGRSALSVRDRRLVTLGVTGSQGRADLVELQLFGALVHEELTEEQIGELVLHLAHYAGWPCATAVAEGAQRAIAAFEARQSDGDSA
jgi:4-carboxymuconolactone decarboxylase